MDDSSRAAHATLEIAPRPSVGSQDGPGADGSAASAYLNGLARGGQRSQRSALRSIAILLGYRTAFEASWATITAADVRSVRARLRTLYAGATVNRMISALRGVLYLAYKGTVPIDVLQELKGNEQVGPPAGRALGTTELGQLLAAGRPTLDGVRDVAVVAVMFGSGLRRDSIPKLDVSDWQEDGTLIARKAKGNKTYPAILHVAMKPFVAEWISLRGGATGPLFPRILRGQLTLARLSTQAVTDLIERLRVRAGVAPFTPHDLRRTFGTELLAGGADPIGVARLMGHEDVKTTMRYDLRGNERLAELLKKLPVPEKEKK